MKLSITKKHKWLAGFIDWFLYMLGYTLVFIIVTSFISGFHIEKSHLLLWAYIIELLIYFLNKTIKPVLVTLTIPITGLTLGLFYPFINVFILKLADWLLRGYFNIDTIKEALIAAILLSIMNFIMERILKKIIDKVKNYE